MPKKISERLEEAYDTVIEVLKRVQDVEGICIIANRTLVYLTSLLQEARRWEI